MNYKTVVNYSKSTGREIRRSSWPIRKSSIYVYPREAKHLPEPILKVRDGRPYKLTSGDISAKDWELKDLAPDF